MRSQFDERIVCRESAGKVAEEAATTYNLAQCEK